MIFRTIFNYIIGFVNITVEGFFVERFINNCINNKIFLWSLKRKSSTLLTVNVNINNFKKIHNIAKKTKCKVKINFKKGIPILFHRYRKRKLFLFLLIPVILLILISSTYIWNIQVIGAKNIDIQELIEQLNQEGISIGKRKSTINTEEVIDNIRLKRSDIAWLSIDMKGTNVIVTLVESAEKPEIIDKNEYCNIVAAQTGLIIKVTADIGTAVVNVGDIVEVGDVLIGGYMEGKYTGTRNVHAKGEVKAKVWYTKKVTSGLTREITEQTGLTENKYSININNFKINLYKTLPNFENYDKISETNKIKLFSNFYLPIEITKTTYIEKKNVKITYGIEELKQLLIKELENQFSEEGIDKLNVLNKVVNVFYKENNQLEVEMIYEVEKDIGIEANLENN